MTSSYGDPIDPTRVREAVAYVRQHVWGRRVDGWQQAEEVCRAALDSLTQRDTVQALSRVCAELKQERDNERSELYELRESHYATARIGSEVLGRVRPERTQDVATDLANTIDQLRSELEAERRKYLKAEELDLQTREKLIRAERELEAARAETERQRKNALNAADLVDARNELCTVLQRQLSTAQADAQGLREALRPLAALTHRTNHGYYVEVELIDAARAALGAGGEEG